MFGQHFCSPSAVDRRRPEFDLRRRLTRADSTTGFRERYHRFPSRELPVLQAVTGLFACYTYYLEVAESLNYSRLADLFSATLRNGVRRRDGRLLLILGFRQSLEINVREAVVA